MRPDRDQGRGCGEVPVSGYGRPLGEEGEGGVERGMEKGKGKGGKRQRQRETGQLEVGRSSAQSRDSRLEMGLTRMI